MANFDSNRWYQIVLFSGTTQSMDGSYLYDHGKGATFFHTTNTSNPEEQWCFFPVNDTYVLRTKASGGGGYLAASVNANETTAGKTVPDMRNLTFADESIYWRVNPWGDGTFWLRNQANGTNWRLNVKSNSLMSLSSNITGDQPGQKFQFNQLGTIDDDIFSAVGTPGVTSTATSTKTTTSNTNYATATPSSTTTATPITLSSKSGLSTGAKAGIGASIGGVALITLLIAGFFLLRRRKRQRPIYEAPTDTNINEVKEAEAPKTPIYELGWETQMGELDSPGRDPVELPGNMHH